MGRFMTVLEGRTPNQRHNARLATRAIDGVIVAPGAEFSFNEKVGTWSRDTGYRKAPVSFNGQLILAWGGGVCQASSTLYNAALLSGMEVTERHQHRHAPGYVAPGRDAAVAFHGIDLRFRNPNPFPVRIRAALNENRLEFGVYGERAPEHPVRIVTQVRSLALPRTIESGGDGAFARIRNGGKAGFDVATYLVSGDRRRLLSTSSYPSMARIVEYSD